MQIEIQAENLTLTNELEDYVKLQLGLDDSGAYDRVNNVLVRLTEVDDTHHNCLITIEIEGIKTSVEVQNTEEDLHYAIDLAAKRARKTAILWMRRYAA
ncbi:MAG: HPF/RaiA family ribosome-associated protein [Porticoccus sp.]|nr:HPF/RaiA family ribosome-associated protein [Porticoccus sp.]MBQ0806494.1 HPF/RaiA family ribosome-associated protein [Porticoccus sp.]